VVHITNDAAELVLLRWIDLYGIHLETEIGSNGLAPTDEFL